MDLDYCSVCYQPTDGSSLYCSNVCRLADTPGEMRDESSLSSFQASPTNTNGFQLASLQFRSVYGSSFDDLEEDFTELSTKETDGERDFYAAQRPTSSPREAPKRATTAAKFTKNQSIDTDWTILSSKPAGIDHRQKKTYKQFNQYVFKKELPSLFTNL